MIEANEGAQASLIQETLKPLLDKRGDIDKEVIALEQQTQAKRDERKEVDKILRAAGLLETASPGRPKANGGLKNPGKYISDAMLVRAREALASDRLPAQFTTKELAEAMNASEMPAKAAIEHLKDDRKLRLVGLRTPQGSPAHVRSAHYEVIGEG